MGVEVMGRDEEQKKKKPKKQPCNARKRTARA